MQLSIPRGYGTYSTLILLALKIIAEYLDVAEIDNEQLSAVVDVVLLLIAGYFRRRATAGMAR